MPPYGQAPQTDEKAIVALVLGALSVFCFGPLTGIPAIIVGVLSRKSIAAANGTKTGGGLAMTGIVAGVASIVLTASAVAAIALAGASASHDARDDEQAFAGDTDETEGDSEDEGDEAQEGLGVRPRRGAVAAETSVEKIDALEVVDLHPGSGALRDQLVAQLARSQASKRTMLVQTTAEWCKPCQEINDSLEDSRMNRALANVSLVRVDIDEFGDELKPLRLPATSVPWFVLLGADLKLKDAISAGEWDDNIPANMAPVLSKFLSGKLKVRRDANGTDL
jgi:thiol-disulfide isomerase/thioredoxin